MSYEEAIKQGNANMQRRLEREHMESMQENETSDRLVQRQLEYAADSIKNLDAKIEELQLQRREFCQAVEKSIAQLEERISRARAISQDNENKPERW